MVTRRRYSNRRREVEFSFGSWKLRIRDYDLVFILLCGFIAFVVWMYFDFRQDTREAHKFLAEQAEETAFLITLTMEQRAALGIEMPESLVRKLYKQNQQEEKYRKR